MPICSCCNRTVTTVININLRSAGLHEWWLCDDCVRHVEALIHRLQRHQLQLRA